MAVNPTFVDLETGTAGGVDGGDDGGEVEGRQSEEELDTGQVEVLRQRSADSARLSPDLGHPLGTLQRSSTRRNSFMLAMEGGEVSQEGVQTGAGPDSVTDRARDSVTDRARDSVTDKAGDSVTDKARDSVTDRKRDSVTPKTPERQKSLLQAKEKSIGYQEMEILDDDEYSRRSHVRWRCVRRCGAVAVCALTAAVVAVILTTVLVPVSLVYVEYYQLALARSRTTGRVDAGRTVYPGCHLLLPDTELVVFRGTAHTVKADLRPFARDGTSVRLQLVLQYFLRAEELGALYRKYGENYETLLKDVIESETLNAAVEFSLDDYRLNRSTVEHRLYQRLALRLQGPCCAACCPRGCGAGADRGEAVDCSSCDAGPDCDRGLHVSLQRRHVQLGAIDLPEEVTRARLRAVLLQTEAEKELLIQESKVEEKRSEQLVQAVLNEAEEVRKASVWQAYRVRSVAEADADLRRQQATIGAARALFSALNVTATRHQLSILLALALRDGGDGVSFHHFHQLALLTDLGPV